MAGVYQKFYSEDITSHVLHARPTTLLASGTVPSGGSASGTLAGWRGNAGGPSGSLSLFDGVRSRPDVRSSDFASSGISVYPMDPVDPRSVDKFASFSGSYPATGSVRMVKARAATDGQETGADWYRRHWAPVELLYEHYSWRYPDVFFTGSYDRYCLYFRHNASYAARASWYSGSNLPSMTSSFSLQAWVKPTSVVGPRDATISSQRARWKLYVTGSTGVPAFSDYASTVTGTVALVAGVWNHVSLVSDGGSASFYVNGARAGAPAYTGTLGAISGPLSATGSFLAVGAEMVLSASTLVFDRGFSGFVFETRAWARALSDAEISGNFGRALTGSEAAASSLLHYSRFNDGPLGTAHGYARGSGSYEYGRAGVHGTFQNFGSSLPRTPSWHPNDHPTFVCPKARISGSAGVFKVLHVPSLFYGRQIATGSVALACNVYNSQGLVRVLRDDGVGGLYLSGSATRPIGGEDYRAGASWAKVGNVFYSEGIVVVTDPALLDFGDDEFRDWTGSPDVLQVSFDGDSRLPVKFFSCRMAASRLNMSNNPTWSRSEGGADNDRTLRRRDDNTVLVTAIVLYDDLRRPVAVAKLAQPIRKREKDRLVVRLRLDV